MLKFSAKAQSLFFSPERLSPPKIIFGFSALKKSFQKNA